MTREQLIAHPTYSILQRLFLGVQPCFRRQRDQRGCMSFVEVIRHSTGEIYYILAELYEDAPNLAEDVKVNLRVEVRTDAEHGCAVYNALHIRKPSQGKLAQYLINLVRMGGGYQSNLELAALNADFIYNLVMEATRRSPEVERRPVPLEDNMVDEGEEI